jgi:hypothetical protein
MLSHILLGDFLNTISYSLLCETLEGYSNLLPKDSPGTWTKLFTAVQFNCQLSLNLPSNPDAIYFKSPFVYGVKESLI